MRLIFSIFLILLLSTQGELCGQSNEEKVDSLKNLISLSENDSMKMEWYNQLRKVALRTNFTEAMEYATHYLTLAEKIDNGFKIAIGNFYIGNLCIQTTQYEKAIPFLMKTLHHFEAEKDSVRIARTLNSVAASYENLGKDSLTLTYFERAYAILKNLNEPKSTAISLNNRSNIYVRAKNYKKAEPLLREALSLIDDPQYYGMYAQIGSNLANLLRESGQYQESVKWYERLIKMTKGKDDYAYTANLKGLGRTKLDLGEADVALKALIEANELIEVNEFSNLKEDVLEDLIRAYESTGNTKMAFKKLKEYSVLQDSLFTQENTQALTDALQKYEAEKKQQQISLLSTQNEIKDLQIEKSRRAKWAYILGLIGLSLIAFMAYRNYRIKVKSNEVLEDKNKVIAKALKDKNLLLKEIHHRVKNNLQVVSSLLNIQSRYIDDDTALEAINESRNRVRSMSLLHQNLYQEDNLTGVEVQTYFNQLLEGLFNTYNIKEGKINLYKEVEPLNLDIDTLVPLGLIVNELISNALKYAFPADRVGDIYISLKEHENQLELKVKDNGIGVSEEEFKSSKSFGNRMINAFVSKLEGEITIFKDQGTTIVLVFKGYEKV